MSKHRIVGAVEIGTSKTVALIGEIVEGRACNIIGKGASTSQGVKKGEIVDFKAASDSTHAAILEAEKVAQVTLDTIYLAQSGGHLRGERSLGTAQVSGADGTVSRQDMERAAADAKSRQLPAGRVYLHHIRNGWMLDGRPEANPLHLKGTRLESAYWSVHGEERMIEDQMRIINGLGLNVEDLILSSLCSAAMVTEEAERQTGVLVIDIGSGTTDYALYTGGHVVRTGVLSVGGDHLTNDLSLGLRVNRKGAEQFKVNHGKAIIDRADKDQKVWLYGDLTIGDRHIPRLAIYQILNARVEEVFRLVRKELGPFLTAEKIPAGAVLTGGTSRLPGLCEVAQRALGVETRLGQNPEWVQEKMRHPEYSTALGLLHFALSGQREPDPAKDTQNSRGLMRKVARLLNLGL